MRAFMSDAAARRRLEDWWGILNQAPVQAEREARAILAEVEPDESLTACFGIERIAARNCAPNEWTDALRDGLRAFVEKE